MKALLAVLLALAGSASQADESVWSDVNYRMGDGLRIPSLGLTLGGYATASYDDLHGVPSRASLDNFSLSAWWEQGRWKVFTEFDYENTLSSRSAQTHDEDRYLALERVYVDYSLGEDSTVRLGKFLTPIGRWNQIHATPLTWTTSRPLVTTVAFPTNVTGLMVSGSVPILGRTVEYSVYGSNGNEIRPSPALDPFHEAIGLRLVAPLAPGLQLGYSYVSFEQERPRNEHRQLYGLDFVWTRQHWELSAELVRRVLHDPGNRNEGGGFVQLVVPLTQQLFAVLRAESYRQSLQLRATRMQVLGLSYRYSSAIVLKAEYVKAQHNDIDAQQGFLSSVSLVF